MQQQSLDLTEVQRIRVDQILARIRTLEESLKDLGYERGTTVATKSKKKKT